MPGLRPSPRLVLGTGPGIIVEGGNGLGMVWVGGVPLMECGALPIGSLKPPHPVIAGKSDLVEGGSGSMLLNETFTVF